MEEYSLAFDGQLFISRDERLVVIQPTWPDGTPWADEAEALTWGNAWIAHRTDPEMATTAEGPSPSQPTATVTLPAEPEPQEEPSA